MRDYFQHQSLAAGDFPGTGILARLYSNWQAHRATVHLLELRDDQLRDLGITRADVDWATHRPITENATTALAERLGGRF